MGRVLAIDLKGRILICMAMLFVSFILLGAGRVTVNVQDRNQVEELEKTRWTSELVKLEKYIPLEHRDEWRKSVEQDPKLFLELNTVNFHAVSNATN